MKPLRALSAGWLLKHMDAPSAPQALLDAVCECYGLNEDQARDLPASEFRARLDIVMRESGMSEDVEPGES